MSDEHLYENVYYPKKASTMDTHKPELLQKNQKQVDEILEIMHTNVSRVLDRQENLDILNNGAESLKNQALVFELGAVKMKRKHWWAHMKTKIIIAIIVAIILIVLIAIIVSAFGGT